MSISMSVVNEIRKKYNERRADGGEGSGNWGHVGRPGEVGGSQEGGGKAFRMTERDKKTKKIKFTSQAKKRVAAKKAISEAGRIADKLADKWMKHPSKTAAKKFGASLKKLERLQKKASHLELRQKSADKKKYMTNPMKYWGVQTPNHSASANILKDAKGKGKMVGGHTSKHGLRGTKEALQRTLPGYGKKKG